MLDLLPLHALLCVLQLLTEACSFDSHFPATDALIKAAMLGIEQCIVISNISFAHVEYDRLPSRHCHRFHAA